jgi:predicted membrane chloride channel (bestrophin family)
MTSSETNIQDNSTTEWRLNGFDVDSFCSPLIEGEKVPDWDELASTEVRRRKILKKVEYPAWRILLSWDGTCLRALFTDFLVWVPVLIFVAIRIHARSGAPEPSLINELGDTDIDILGGFLSFLLVLFVNQTNSRFTQMYQLSKKCCGLIQDVAGLMSSQFPSAIGGRLVRYMNAAHAAGYVGLGGPYTKKNFFDQFNQEHHLLNQKEMAKIHVLNMDTGSDTFKELVTWCQREVTLAKKKGLIDTYEAHELHQRVLDFRAAMDGIYDFCDQPTHFFYIHFLVLISAVYLPLFAVDNAYSSGWGEDADWRIETLNGTIVLLQAIFVVGLRLLGQNLTDPYGDDLEDLSVITYINIGLETSNIIMSAQPPADEVEEIARANKGSGDSSATFA